MDTKVIKVKYLRDIVELVKYGDWVDLRTGIDVTIKKGESFLIPLGVAMKLPKGYEAIVAPRSSTFGKWGILQTNSIGVIDEKYCGDNDEWHFSAYAVRDTFIPKNTRIAQFRIQEHQPDCLFITVENMTDKNRGGFGSTGEK